MKKILLVEDDQSLNRGINFKLTKEGYKVFSASSIEEARENLREQEIDLIILDVTLPDGNGFDFCQEIRQRRNTLIVFLTACDQEVDVVTGLDMGGDDYITKPFSLTILISKINALLRRNIPSALGKIISKDLEFFPEKMVLIKKGKEIFLSKTELKLLTYLMKNPQQIITKEQLLSQLWDIDGCFVDPNTVAVNVRRLREKIEDDPSNPLYIKTVRGIGYTWNEGCHAL
ncbi:response regulator transcription factor [Irregularibacter muris]|uniref:Stage 0 sporulation protein A homolog n=1 Tax=Irregularibacter muris TaxID=1796619 RepID=A0AAE3HFL5_9FIRM|nr:response regulator transcription factor [Irregularibacter muris]MCR1898597.1 response regulator transcription factor [Irregularibacter muris]